MGGPFILGNLIKQHDDYNENDTDKDKLKIVKKVHEQFIAYLLLHQADQSKYGSLLHGLG